MRARSLASGNTPRDYLEIAAAFAILVGLVFTLRHFALLPHGISVSDTVSLGLAFVIGLVASVSSCIAVTGGLLVAVAAKYNASHAHLTGWQRLQPHLYFNAGRLVSYALLGGAVGALGSALMLSPTANGALTLVASAIMIVLGLQMLGLLSPLGRLMPSDPQSGGTAHSWTCRARRPIRPPSCWAGHILPALRLYPGAAALCACARAMS